MKKRFALLLSLLVLTSLFVPPVSAGDTGSAVLTTDAYNDPVQYSVTDSNLSGWGLAFCFTLQANGVAKTYTNSTSLTNATLSYNGEDCPITRIGTVVTNQKKIGCDASLFTREGMETANSEFVAIRDIRAAKMYKVADTSCVFAVRITNIPFVQEERLVYARPYVEITYGGERITLYGAIDSTSYALQAKNLDVKLPFYGADVDGKGRITVGDTAVLCETVYIEIVDELDEWMVMTDAVNTSTVTLGCYDADGTLLTEEELQLPDMSSANSSETFSFQLPAGTVEIKILDAQIIYWTEWEDYE